ncbi:UNVERIFIED_CONTAM: hypothetical protein FKN15_028753 [Acipenser sinensis]
MCMSWIQATANHFFMLLIDLTALAGMNVTNMLVKIFTYVITGTEFPAGCIHLVNGFMVLRVSYHAVPRTVEATL